MLISFFVLNFIYAQQIWQWATDKIGANTYAMAVDANGNTYVTGQFSGTLIIANDTLVGGSIFIAKISNLGTPLWGRKANNSTNPDKGIAIALDNSGNLYVLGTLRSPQVIFGSDTLITSFNDEDNFLAKLDTAGNFLWAQKVGHGHIPIPNNHGGASTDNLGNIYITGTFIGTGVFDTITLVSNGDYDMFIAKYNSAGNCLWAKKAGAGHWDQGCAIKADAAGNCYAAGYFGGDTIMFDTIQRIIPPPGCAIFIIKYNALGIAELVTGGYVSSNINSGDYQSPNGIDIDNMNNIYATGTFVGSAFGLSSTSPSYKNVFTVKFSASGTLLWAKKGGGTGNNGDWGEDIAADNYGNCYVTGRIYSGNAIFSPFTPSLGMFVIAYNSSGTALWIKQASGSSNYGSIGYAIGLAGNSIYVAGSCSGDTVHFDSVNLYGALGGFVAKMDHTTSIVETDLSNSVVLFPNPSTSELIIQSSQLEQTETIEIYSTLGEKVFSQQTTNSKQQTVIDVSSLQPGIYFVTLRTENGSKAVRKFVKM